MLQTLNPYTSTAKTAEIMARYRPIAPRPQSPLSSSNATATDVAEADPGSGSGSGSGSMSPTIRQSPYLRNVWPHLQSRPTRTRKRGRTSLGPPPPPPTTAFKRPRTLLQGLSPPFHVTTSPARSLSIHGFAPPQPPPTAAAAATLVTLPLLPCSSLNTNMHQPNVIDLNKVVEIPEEKDFLAQLQKPTTTNVISPTPIRLIPSSITIRAIKDDSGAGAGRLSPVILKKQEEIEKELESQVLPAFVSDSNNKVRLVNSAYKEMVGQPECPWVESMVGDDACRSICGEVVLNLMDLGQDLTVGFSCWARIQWGINGKRNLVNAFGEVMRLACETKDYKFAWRFHTREASEAASNV